MRSSYVVIPLVVFTLATACRGAIPRDSTPKSLVSITVTPPNSSIALGMTEQLMATGTYSDGSTSDLTESVTWSSSAPSVAAISNAEAFRGRVTSEDLGSTKITARLGEISGSTTLTIIWSTDIKF